MQDTMKKLLAMLLVMALATGAAQTVRGTTVQAAGKRTVYYDFECHYKSKGDDLITIPYKCTLKKNTLTIRGFYTKASKENALWGKKEKKGKKTFKLSKNAKFYVRGGDGSTRMSKKEFFKGGVGGVGMLLKVVNGKVVKIALHS